MSTLKTKRKNYVSFILPVFVILLTLINYSRLSGTENIRAIHVVTLLVMGMGIGILLRNLIAYFRGQL
ncbi:MAG: hypothetical protein JST55_06200 [Bacteroidetes bacterium]|nr:hypothetical protein [Bacteroidota bacterium]